MRKIVLRDLVFDGVEEDLYSLKLRVGCPGCGSGVDFDADDLTPLGGADNSRLSNLLAKDFGLRRRSGGLGYENEKGLEAFFFGYRCMSCGAKGYVVASVGEIQPTRFQAILEGVLLESEGS